MRSASLGSGFVDADPTLVAVVIIAVALAAVVYVVHRIRGGSGGG